MLTPGFYMYLHRYEWGPVSHRSVGVVKHIRRDMTHMLVDFPEWNEWNALVEEMELYSGECPSDR